MSKKLIIALFSLIMVLNASQAFSDEVFDFEDGELQGWDIPDWAMEQNDQVSRSLKVTDAKAYEGNYSLELECDFPGDLWTAAVVEFNREIDLTPYSKIMARIYIPKKARAEGFFQARIIFVAGPWWWIEQRHVKLLDLGKWNEIEANLDVTEANQRSYWKRKSKDGTFLKNRDNIKKIIIRIEYDASEKHAGPAYEGPVYIDDIVFVEKPVE
jgi:hypothetical protein